MIWIERPQTDPWFNLAAEEFILKHFPEDILMLWQSTSSVVVGKHQNTVAEVDTNFTEVNHIPIIRRISGGGTVYHDLGNLNYTFIKSTDRDNYPVDFKTFTKPLIEFLRNYQLDVRFEGKNNLRVGNKKFSGNAAHVFKNRVMHHGTILFETDLEKLEKVIQSKQGQYTDKAIKSVRTEVVNLSQLLTPAIKLNYFKTQFKHFLTDYFNIKNIRQFTDDQSIAIRKLAETKYKSWAWNMGYSPKFTVHKKVETAYGHIRANLQVKAGIIDELDLYFEDKKLIKIEDQLRHHPYKKIELLNQLEGNRFSETLVNALF